MIKRIDAIKYIDGDYAVCIIKKGRNTFQEWKVEMDTNAKTYFLNGDYIKLKTYLTEFIINAI